MRANVVRNCLSVAVKSLHSDTKTPCLIFCHLASSGMRYVAVNWRLIANNFVAATPIASHHIPRLVRLRQYFIVGDFLWSTRRHRFARRHLIRFRESSRPGLLHGGRRGGFGGERGALSPSFDDLMRDKSRPRSSASIRYSW